MNFDKDEMPKFWVLSLVADVAFMFLIVSGSSTHDETSIISGNSMTATTSIREVTNGSNTRRKINSDNMNLEDYHQIDPAPTSSAAAVTSGPIEHATPLMPYIPNPTSPYGTHHDGSPESPFHPSHA